MLTAEEAKAKLAAMCEADDETLPLSDTELSGLLEDYRIAFPYAISTEFAYGQSMVPVPGNGRMYTCAQAGTTGTTTPDWSKRPRQVIDGTVFWEDDGTAYSELWDMEGAARAGWQKKARKAAGLIDQSDRDTKIAFSDLHRQCLAMAETFTERFVA